MKLRSVAMWAVLGMSGSTAGALAIPVSSSGTTTLQPDDGPAGRGTSKQGPSDISHFSAGKTLTVDARLGHATVPSGGPSDTFLFASVTGTDKQELAAPPLQLAIVIDRSGSMKG